MNLEQYQCQRCGRFFYINKMDKSDLDFKFTCPYGCEYAGALTREIETNIVEIKEVN